MEKELLRVVECFEQSLVVNEGVPTAYACDQLRFAARNAAADLAALRLALQDLAAMADGQRQTFNEFWEVVETLRPGRHLGGDAAVIRGGYMSMADKARAALARTEGRPA